MKNLGLSAVVWLAGLFGLLLAAPASAQPYSQLGWNEYPSRETMHGGEWEYELFPDLTAGVITYSEFGEEQLGGGQDLGILTVVCSRQSYLSVIHYSASGNSFIAHPGLLVPEGHQVSVSIMFPAAQTEGVSLLLVWDRAPDSGWLTMLARHPNRTDEPIPHVVSEGWFQRSPGEMGRHPWEDSFDNSYRRVPIGFSSSFPQVFAGIDSYGTWRTKDCSVENTGITQQFFDMSGSSNVLELNTSDRLILHFYLPADTAPSTAWLYLLAYSNPQSTQSEAVVLEVAINNWYIEGAVPKRDDFGEMQPLGFDVSHFLQGGYNLIEVSLSPFAEDGVLLDNIELWID